MTFLKYPVTFVYISFQFVYIEGRESGIRNKVRTVTKAIGMVHKILAFKTPVMALENLFYNGTLTSIERGHSLPETEIYKII